MQAQARELSFKGQVVHVGLDASKSSWKVAIYVGTTYVRVFTQPPSPEALMHYLYRTFPGARYKIVYEAGYFGFWIHRQLTALGADCSVINPADVPTTNKERRGKTDRVDAIKLARSHANGELQPIYVPTRGCEEDRALIRTRRHYAGKQTRVKCQIKALLCEFGYQLPEDIVDRYWSRAYIGWLQSLTFTRASGKLTLDVLIEELLHLRQTIATLTRAIHRMADEEPYQQPYRWLRTIGGIGPLAAMIFLTEIVEINRFRSLDRLASFVGLVPDQDSSGDQEHFTGITKRRNPELRYILVECAWLAIRSDPALLEAFNRYARRMPKNLAIVRVARKLLARMRFVLKHQTPYVPGVVQDGPPLLREI